MNSNKTFSKIITITLTIIILISLTPISMNATAANDNRNRVVLFADELHDTTAINRLIRNNGLKLPISTDGFIPDAWGTNNNAYGRALISYSISAIYYEYDPPQHEYRINSLNIANLGLTGSVDLSGMDKLSILNCGSNALTSLNLAGCTSLLTLNCGSNALTSLNLAGCTSLWILTCNGNKLTSLNLPGRTLLSTLNCDGNALTSLNLAGCTSLMSLRCNSNKLTSLNLAGFTSLNRLECRGNALTSLDVAGFTSLTVLYCDNNKLTSLNIAGCTSLKSLYFGYNALSSVDLPDCTSIDELECCNNKFTSLNIAKYTSLKYLCCGNNAFSSLDFSGFTSLVHLDCYNSTLTSLNIDDCISLLRLYCYDNNLTSLNLAGCPSLYQLNCENNALSNLDVSNLDFLYYLDCRKNFIANKTDVKGFTGTWDDDDGVTYVNISSETIYTGRFYFTPQKLMVSIAGVPIVKETLTADVSGLPEGEFTYQWNKISLTSKGETIKSMAIKDATDSTYIPVYDDVDYAISVTVKGNNLNEEITSEQTKPVHMLVGYPFHNDETGFGYPVGIDNPISIDVFKRVFPNTWQMEYDIYNKWGGNCYGMSITTQLFRSGSLKTDSFQYEVAREWAFYSPPVLRLRSEIEAYQLVQHKPEVQQLNTQYSSDANDFRGLLAHTEAFEKGQGEPYTLGLAAHNTTSKEYIFLHSVVPYCVEYPEAGSSNRVITLYVYDPNYPLDMSRNITIAEDYSYWFYDLMYNSMYPNYPGAFRYRNAVEVSNYLETPSMIYNSAAGISASETVTLSVAGRDIIMDPKDFKDDSGMVLRYLPEGVRDGDSLLQHFFIMETEGEMSISTQALDGHIEAYLYNANGGSILQATAQNANFHYTLTINPGNSLLLSTADNRLRTDCSFFFREGDELLKLTLQAEHTGSLQLERINDQEFLLLGNNFMNVVIGDGEHELLNAATLPERTLLRVQYGENGEIEDITLENPETFTITYNANGGLGTMENGVVAQNTPYTVAENMFHRENYVFIDWNTAGDGTGVAYDEGEVILNVQDNIVLYAQWQEITSPPTGQVSDAEFLQQRATAILRNGLSQNNLRLTGKVLTLTIDGREFILSINANNRNVSGEVALGDGFFLVFDIKGNGSNVKDFRVIQR